MAVNVAHRRAPKIVLQEGGQRGLSEHVLVPHHRGYIVVHEITTQRVQVTGDSDQSDRRVNAPYGRFAPLRIVASASTDPSAALAAATIITSSHDSQWGTRAGKPARENGGSNVPPRSSGTKTALLIEPLSSHTSLSAAPINPRRAWPLYTVARFDRWSHLKQRDDDGNDHHIDRPFSPFFLPFPPPV